jgi:hypothetical protein
MTPVTVACPECGRWFVVNGRGRCTCGAYLVHHMAGRRVVAMPPGRVWVFKDGHWQRRGAA